jgi:hypothetical protein
VFGGARTGIRQPARVYAMSCKRYRLVGILPAGVAGVGQDALDGRLGPTLASAVPVAAMWLSDHDGVEAAARIP